MFGYDEPRDSPASKPASGGAVTTTYVSGPSGLLVIDLAGALTYEIVNRHGDVVRPPIHDC